MWTPQSPVCLPAEPESALVAFLSGPAAQAVTWLLVIVGWVVGQFISHRFAMRRTRRDEERAIVVDIIARIVEARDQAIAYYTTDATQPGAETARAQLRYKIKTIGSRIAWLSSRKRKWVTSKVGALRSQPPHYYDLESELIELRFAVTGGDFDSPDRKAVSPDALLILGIWSSSDQLIGTLQKAHDEAN